MVRPLVPVILPHWPACSGNTTYLLTKAALSGMPARSWPGLISLPAEWKVRSDSYARKANIASIQRLVSGWAGPWHACCVMEISYVPSYA